jgi:hypothetical protein
MYINTKKKHLVGAFLEDMIKKDDEYCPVRDPMVSSLLYL